MQQGEVGTTKRGQLFIIAAVGALASRPAVAAANNCVKFQSSPSFTQTATAQQRAGAVIASSS